MIFLSNCTHKSISHKKADSEASAKRKEVKGIPDKINELILKTKADLKEGLIPLTDWLSFGERRVRLKLEAQSQGAGKNLDVDGQMGWWVLIIGQFLWTSYVYHS